MAASSSSSSLAPPEVPMELHAGNRDRLVAALRAHLSASARPLRSLALLQGGEEQTRYCSDHLELFRQESYFAYLFGVREPGFYGAVDIASGQSILFAPRLPPDYAVWMGEIKPLSYFKDRYKVDMVFYVDEIAQVLQDRFNEHGKPLLFLLYGKSTDSGNYSKPSSFEGMEKVDTDLSTLHPILTECRVIKSDMELALIQYANDVSSEAHIEAEMEAIIDQPVPDGQDPKSATTVVSEVLTKLCPTTKFLQNVGLQSASNNSSKGGVASRVKDLETELEVKNQAAEQMQEKLCSRQQELDVLKKRAEEAEAA